MPGKSKPKSADKPTQFAHQDSYKNVEWVNYDLTAAEREALKKLPFWSDEWDGYLLRACDEGYRFTIKFDGFGKCYACYMSNPMLSHPNYGLMLTGRGSCPTKALRQVLYKHVVVAKEVWEVLRGNAAPEIDD